MNNTTTLISMSGVARQTGIGYFRIYKATKKGDLPPAATVVGKRRKYSQAEVTWIEHYFARRPLKKPTS